MLHEKIIEKILNAYYPALNILNREGNLNDASFC